MQIHVTQFAGHEQQHESTVTAGRSWQPCYFDMDQEDLLAIGFPGRVTPGNGVPCDQLICVVQDGRKDPERPDGDQIAPSCRQLGYPCPRASVVRTSASRVSFHFGLTWLAQVTPVPGVRRLQVGLADRTSLVRGRPH